MARNSKGIEVAEIISDRCIGCQICIGECPVGAIELSPQGTAVIDPEVCIGCGKCSQVCPVEAVRFERKKKAKKKPPVETAGAGEETARGPVAVFIEIADGRAAQVSWELAGKATELARKRNSRVIGFLVGNGVEEAAREAFSHGCEAVHVIDHPDLDSYLSKPFGKAVAELCRLASPEIVLMGATPLGRDLSPIVATHLATGLTADCTGLDIEEETGLLLMTRPTFGGNIMATIFCEHRRPQMCTVRPKVFRMSEPAENREGEIVRHQWEPSAGRIPEIVAVQLSPPGAEGSDITRSPALVVAGKGACDPATFPLLEELAETVGGMVACSRPVVEAGLMPYERQVGQTGRTVAPKLYIGVGVSGAVQHLVGMQGSEKIIAVNADPEAPIFKVADVCLVGDYRKILPVLIRELRARGVGAERETDVV